MAEERTRTYSWDDPFALRDAMAGRSGLELMQAMANGEISPPPIAQTLGFRLAEAERGHALFECQPAEYHYNPIGVVHAGLAMTLMDSAMGLAEWSPGESAADLVSRADAALYAAKRAGRDALVHA